MSIFTGWAGAAALLALMSCSSTEETPAEVRPVEAEMCPEHGVLEAVCTKCNPALIPVFQAKGDWCPEHGFPLSFCPIHHPERGGRPLGEVKSDGAPADGLKIRFKTRETAKMAGIAAVPARLAEEAGGVEAVARLTWDGTRHALVTARAPGAIQQVVADVGARVAAGDALAIVQSAAVAGDRSAYTAAKQRVENATRTLARKQELLAAGIVSRNDLVAAEQELAQAKAEAGALAAGLGAVGWGSGQGYTVTAPLPGIVTRRDVTVGMSVEAGAPLFEVVDPSSLWAEIDVPELDVALVQPGQAVTVTVDGVTDRTWTSSVAYVAPSIDPQTRTTLARAALDNADGVLRANMYGTARIAVGGDRQVVVVPAAAVQRAKDVDLIFVKLAEDAYETRRVRVVTRQGGEVWLAGGVKPGELVVTVGSFLLKTETLKDSIGAGCCDGD
jgi:cobalt-zinc-cadmium efflux system membrane fusion protein